MENQDHQDFKGFRENKDLLAQRDLRDTEVSLVYRVYLGQ